MKKILCLALVLVLTMSVAFTASAADATGSFDLSVLSDFSATFDAIAEFLKLEGIMKYVNEFHIYMDDFYRELDTVLKAAGVVLNGLLSSVF